MDNFDTPQTLALFALIFIAAVLYASVGHGGASGYLAAMALFGVAPAAMKPLALSMNIMVAGWGFVRLYRAGYFKFSLFWPFALGSIPAAYLGGAWKLTDTTYRTIVGVALLLAALRMFAEYKDDIVKRTPPFSAALLLGAGDRLIVGIGRGGRRDFSESHTAHVALDYHARVCGTCGGVYSGEFHRRFSRLCR